MEDSAEAKAMDAYRLTKDELKVRTMAVRNSCLVLVFDFRSTKITVRRNLPRA